MDHNTNAETQQQESVASNAPSEDASAISVRAQPRLQDPRSFQPGTFIRPSLPEDLLANPAISSTALKADVFITSPFHIAGGCVAGKLNLSIRSSDSADVHLGRVAVDLVGIEELSWTSRRILLALALEFIDDSHPPPPNILRQQHRSSGPFWSVKPGDESFPFSVNLPLDVGPGTFSSASVRIRYVIYGTVLFKIGNTKFLVRCCRDVAIIPSVGELRRTQLDFDREIRVFEERAFTPAQNGYLKLTASLSRPYWFSGGSAFVDVSIENGSLYHIGKIRVKLVRHVTTYKVPESAEGGIATDRPRVPAWESKRTMARSELNAGTRWTGLNMDKRTSVTCEIEIPKGQLTIPRGKFLPGTFFEVQYFIVATTGPKLDPRQRVHVVLPIRILHMHSIHEALLSGFGNKPSFPSFSVARRSLPTQHPSTTSTIRRRRTESDLSQVEPVPIADASESSDHVTSGVATPPRVASGSRTAEATSVRGSFGSARNSNKRKNSAGSYIPSIRYFFGKA
ncbi:hypothetical protein DRE_01410 [Drechslerella stenobrocha 248]|uniref:Arrestin C-terminal-like domain-containing protein n=1 Tax=Drechslerella stenobrocha 248 TaxID=1043628 RepID=W7HVY8_9PEZI|nr:hypothetical protein DRE_01410 [Drechslerella stenobrocha 248]